MEQERKESYQAPELIKHDSLQVVTGVDICTSASDTVCQGPE